MPDFSVFAVLLATLHQQSSAQLFDFSSLTRSCPPLTNISYGSVSDRTLYATYVCDAGFLLLGQRFRICLLGRWVPQTPECVPGSGCVPPPSVSDATYNPTKDTYTAGDEVTYTCSSGFLATSETTLQCNSYGTWAPAPPRCTQSGCPAPTAPTNGSLSPVKMSYQVGDVLSFGCGAGYLLFGAATVTCGADNSWSAAVPVCKRVCGAPPMSGGVLLVNDPQLYVENTTVEYRCSNEGLLEGPETNTCGMSGTWENDSPTCTETLFKVNCSGKHYFAPTEKVTWAEAYYACAQLGMHLFVPTTEAETSCVCGAMTTGTLLLESYWIGVTRTSIGQISACGQSVLNLWASDADRNGINGLAIFMMLKQLYGSDPAAKKYYICEQKEC